MGLGVDHERPAIDEYLFLRIGPHQIAAVVVAVQHGAGRLMALQKLNRGHGNSLGIEAQSRWLSRCRRDESKQSQRKAQAKHATEFLPPTA